MASTITVTSDSSFYICFLDDINKPQCLCRFLDCKAFKFIMGLIIKEEIKKSPNYQAVEDLIESHVQIFSYYNYGEILKSFLSLEEIRKGEHEVIVISYILHFLKVDFLAVLDDDAAKKFLENNFSEVLKRVMGTVGFVENCCCKYGIMSKDEATTILNLIRGSRFRVKDEIVIKAIEKIRGC